MDPKVAKSEEMNKKRRDKRNFKKYGAAGKPLAATRKKINKKKREKRAENSSIEKTLVEFALDDSQAAEAANPLVEFALDASQAAEDAIEFALNAFATDIYPDV